MDRTIRDVVCNQQPVTAPPTLQVQEAARIMRQWRVGAMMVGTTMDVTVEAGKVTVLRYTPKDGIGATLERVETRTA